MRWVGGWNEVDEMGWEWDGMVVMVVGGKPACSSASYTVYF